MSAALKGHDRTQIAREMAEMLGSNTLSAGMLNNYVSPSKTADITLPRFKAFVRAVNAPKLWDVAVSDDGLLVLKGDEARLAEIARLQQVQRDTAGKLRLLRSLPVNVAFEREG